MTTSDILMIVAGCGIVFATALAVYAKIANRKRRIAGIKEQANQMGLQVIDEPDGKVLRRFDSFKLFDHGVKPRLTNLIVVDSKDSKISIFDYRFVTNPTGKGGTTHNQTVVAIQSQQLACPEIMMRPKTFADKIDSKIGFRPPDYGLPAKFTKQFVLHGPDEAAIQSFFTSKVIEYFQRHPKDSLEAREDTLFFYRNRTLRKSDELKDLLAQAHEVFGVLTEANV